MITIVPADPGWPAEFAGIAARLRASFGAAALRIDHIGSTSVPGLAAKDVIDVQVTVAALDGPAITAALEAAGITARPEIQADHRPPGCEDDPPAAWAKAYGSVLAPRRIHVHVRVEGAANQRYALLFRDFLRADALACGGYQAVKVALARLHADDVNAYYEVKDPVCDIVMAGAERWATATDWTPGSGDA